MLNVAIGYDPSESIAAQVLAHSIHRHASKPVAITFLMLHQLKHVHQRARHPLQSTEFSFTRFLTPWLFSNGHSIFLDCDMLVLDDIHKVLTEATSLFAPVSVVKHDHQPESETKMLGQAQTVYPCKNWSSFMLFWGGHRDCVRLTPEIVDTASGLDLHQFKWVENGPIGELPKRWNHLVGYDPNLPSSELSCIHWTEGGPWWEDYVGEPYAEFWFEELALMNRAYKRA